MLPVIRTNRADEDLIEIWSYIAIGNISAADRFLDAIEARWDKQITRALASRVWRDRWSYCGVWMTVRPRTSLNSCETYL
ncbi:type II toxin-antitoxin system RelE/ParE family toxin [Rhizobium ruizarguesonis]|uniref:type II toxin-antitoxin system RelE/ParE family toxin n=1 Tax=Rhizobium ruizarguesonis TaxID=2081791 RepID=UPI003718B36D